MNKQLAAAITAVIGLVMFLYTLERCVGWNDSQHWVVLQTVSGEVKIIDKPGPYGKWFGTDWEYPYTIEAIYEADNAVDVTFNDNGKAQVSTYAKIQLPMTTEKRLIMHRDYKGNEDAIKRSVGAEIKTCAQASSPVMSASEHQASRSSEFSMLVSEQLNHGLYQTSRMQIELEDISDVIEAVDEKGNKITQEKKAKVWATQIVRNKDNQPQVIKQSPLVPYGFTIPQLSIINCKYDDQTLLQFQARKESYLKAETSKALRQEEVQERLRIEEMGRRQIAEIEAKQNQIKTQAVIEAQKEQEVAEVQKKKAVTLAQQRVEVAQKAKSEAEELKSIAKIEAETAELKKAATIAAAEAKQKAIELGGTLSEEKKVLAEIAAKRDVEVAVALANSNVPEIVISGGKEGGDVMGSMLQMLLLKQNGMLTGRQPL